MACCDEKIISFRAVTANAWRKHIPTFRKGFNKTHKISSGLRGHYFCEQNVIFTVSRSALFLLRVSGLSAHRGQ